MRCHNAATPRGSYFARPKSCTGDGKFDRQSESRSKSGLQCAVSIRVHMANGSCANSHLLLESFDNAKSSGNRIRFFTDGMLLQELLGDPNLEQYSAVVIDEAHERTVNVDLLLGLLRNLIVETSQAKRKRASPLRLVVMSAVSFLEYNSIILANCASERLLTLRVL
jgi:hypothetical protein